MLEKLSLVVGVFMLLAIVLRAAAWLFGRVGGSIAPPPVRDARRSGLAGDDQGDRRRAADVGGPWQSPVVGGCSSGQSPTTDNDALRADEHTHHGHHDDSPAERRQTSPPGPSAT